MALVEYSDSDSPSESPIPAKRRTSSLESPATKRIRIEKKSAVESGIKVALPPLPAKFRHLYSVSTRISVQDDPTLHDGRRRAIPHVVGNWPTHLYLEWYPTKPEIATLSDVLRQSQSAIEDGPEIHSLLHSDLGVQLPLHISLSRPVVLTTDERHSFAELFESSIRDSEIRPFSVTVRGLDWASNFDKSRWFLVLAVNKPENDALNRLLKLCNRTLALFRQPPLYEDAAVVRQTDRKQKGRKYGVTKEQKQDFSDCFHISIAWSLTEPSMAQKNHVKSLNLEKLCQATISFDSVKTKIGNQISSMELPGKSFSQAGLPGL